MTTPGAAVDRSGPPRPGATREFRFPDFERYRLGNGLEVLLAPMARVPLVRLDLYVPAGAQHDPRGKEGLATLTAGLLDEGSRHRTATEIASAAEQLGGRLSTGAGWNAAYVTTSFLAKDMEVGVELLADIALEPTFPEEEVERLRQERLADLLQQRNEPAALARKSLSRAIYGDSVYGGSVYGRETSVSGLTRPEILDFYGGHFATRGATLIGVGDFQPGHLLGTLETTLGKAPLSPPPPLPDLEPTAPKAVQVTIVDRPGAAQTELRLGHAAVERTHPKFALLQVLNSLLGGKFTSRINLNLRERHGFTYGAHSSFSGRHGPGPFVVSTAVATEVAGAAVRETIAEIRRIQDELVDEAELADTKSYLRGVFVQQLQTIDDLAFRLATLAVYGLPDDYFDSYFRQVDEVDRETVRHLAREFLHPGRLAIVAVGPAASLRPQLEPFGPVDVWEPQDA